MTLRPPALPGWNPPQIDGKFFVPCSCEKIYLVGTSHKTTTFGWFQLARDLSLRVFHHGPDPVVAADHPGVSWQEALPDDKRALRWGKCRFVNGLQTAPGFPAAVVEGLCCGARPVVWDSPHNRAWLGDHAIYLDPDPDQPVIDQLRRLVVNVSQAEMMAQKVTVAERDWAITRFGVKAGTAGQTGTTGQRAGGSRHGHQG